MTIAIAPRGLCAKCPILLEDSILADDSSAPDPGTRPPRWATDSRALLQSENAAPAARTRATDELRAVLAQPFLSRWIFDVEILARFILLRRETGSPPVEDIIYELPLDVWHDIRGSKLKAIDFPIVGADLVRIQIHYFVRSATARAALRSSDRPRS